MVAMQWAASHPGDFERAVLINSSDRRSGPPWRRLRPWALRQGLRIVTSRSPLEHERHVLALTTHLEPGERFDRILTDREVTRRQRPVRGWTALAQLLAAVRYRGPTTLPIPTLVLTSDADDMVSSACSRALAQRLEADLRVHDRAGHDLTTDEPAWCLDQIMSWLHP
jgi:pimeloyl-ACP methyl ester carboxylesterase